MRGGGYRSAVLQAPLGSVYEGSSSCQCACATGPAVLSRDPKCIQSASCHEGRFIIFGEASFSSYLQARPGIAIPRSVHGEA
eukprot:2922459-Pyramimonas_sp.AAC.1